MTEDAQILIARLLAHQTLRREDKLVKRALSDEIFRTELDARLKACGMKFVDNVYADYVTLALTRDSESKVFGTKETWQNNNFGLARDGVALLVVLWSLIILPKRERQEAHQLAEEDQNDMFGKEKPLPRAEDTSIGISYRALLADFGDKLVNRASLTWRGMSEEERALPAVEMLAAKPALMKRPAIDLDGQYFLGWTANVKRALGAE